MRKVIPRRRAGWLALLQVLLLSLTLVFPVAAATPDKTADMIRLLTTYRIIRGDEQGNLNLDQPIKRAEMITIMVRALGGEEDAQLYKGAGIFKDTQGHWAQANINYAAARQLVKGDGNGYVRPEDPISYAEALTFLLRVIEREPKTGDWPVNVLLAASQLGLVPVGVNAGNVGEPAVRGLVFASLGKALTETKTADGKTYLQTYVDSDPPQLTLKAVTSPTKEARVQVSGTATGAVKVTVKGKAVNLSGTNWSTQVDLQYGANKIVVIAEDLAGNQDKAEIAVERKLPVARLEITGAAKVQKGTTSTYEVKAFDETGKAVALTDVTARTEGGIGTFNVQTGVLAAAQQAAKGKIIVTTGNVSASINVDILAGNPAAVQVRIRPVNEGRSVSITQDMLVQVEVVDSNGNHLNDDYGRSVTLNASGLSGLTVTPTTAETNAGVATFRVRSTSVGNISLVASSPGLASNNTTAAFGTNIRVQLSSDPASLVIGGTQSMARIRATLVNELGQTTTNTNTTSITISLSQTGSDGYISDPYLTIYPGASTSTASGDDGMFTVGASQGTARITGTVTSGHNISVDPLSIGVTMPQVGSASGWDVIYPGGQLQPNNPTPYTFYLRMADASGNTIPAAFAYQLEITTSNNEPKVAGIPQGVTISLGSSGANPVTDGIAEGTANDGYDVIARTLGGISSLNIGYDKVGQVTVKVIGMPATSAAYASDGTVGSATAGNVVAAESFTFNFTTEPTAVKLTVDSVALGTDQTVGAVPSSGGQSFKVKAYFTNGTNWIPGTTGTVTMAKVSGNSTIEPSVKTIPVINGKAEFTISSNGTPGTDIYQVTAKKSDGTPLTNATSNQVRLAVQNQGPTTPTVLAARGMSGVNPGAWYYVAASDDSLEMDLATNGGTGYGVVRVFQVNQSTPFFTSAPVDLSASTVRVSIPKSKLPSGRLQYQVTFKNAVGETNPRIPTPEYVTNATVATNLTITSARYDRVNSRLYVYGTGFSSSSATYPDTISPGLLTVTDVSLNQTNPGAGTVNLSGATLVSFSSSGIILNVSGLTGTLDALSGADVTLSGSSGWYVRYNGEIAPADSGNPITPMAKVTYVSYDKVNRRLILTGAGFSTGSVNVNTMSITNGTSTYNLTYASNYRQSDSEWSISISGVTGLEAALQSGSGFSLTAQNGWFSDGTVAQNQVTGIPVYERIAVSSVTYDSSTEILTINGSGFSGWTVVPDKLDIVNLGVNPPVTRDISGTFLADQSSDTQIKIQLTSGANPLSGSGRLTGSSLYVTGEAGWMTKDGKQSAPIPLWILLLPPQS